MTRQHATVTRILVISAMLSPLLCTRLDESLRLEVLIDVLSVHSISKENCNFVSLLFVLDAIDCGGNEFHMSPLHVYLHVAALDNHYSASPKM